MKMLQNILIFIFSSLIFSCANCQSKDYSDFKIGKFTYSKNYEFNDTPLMFPNNLNLDTVRVVRTIYEQKELYPGVNRYSIYKIKWLDIYSYELELLETTMGIFNKGDRINVQIISRTDSSYNYISKSKLGKIKCTLIKYQK